MRYTAGGCVTPDTLVTWPATAPEREVPVERFTMALALDAPVADGRFPLVVVSHGSGGTPFSHRLLARDLARAGFVVAAAEHPGNNRRDDARAGTRALLEARPRELRATIDAAFADPTLGAHLVPGVVAAVGHSLGAYTALALAGGRPWSGPHDRPPTAPSPVPIEADPRVRALVLLAPATPWYWGPGTLAAVHVPILAYSGARDPVTPPSHAERVVQGVPDASRVVHRVVEDAGHFSFLAPYPPALVTAAFAPAQDLPGFDRAAFHDRLGVEVAAWLHSVLARPGAGR